jgi:hypothetical protein
MEYITDLWNLIDFTSNSFFLAWIFLRAVAWFIVQVKQFKKKKFNFRVSIDFDVRAKP